MLIYSANMYPRNILHPTNCTAKNSPRDRATWIAIMLPQLDKFPEYAQAHMDVEMDTEGQNGPADNAGTNVERAAEQQQLAHPQQATAKGNTASNYAQRTGKQPTIPSRTCLDGTSNGATTPERRAQSVPIDPSKIELRHHPNRFQPMAEQNNANPDAKNDMVREGSVSYASNSRGNKRKEPIPLTSQILLL